MSRVDGQRAANALLEIRHLTVCYRTARGTVRALETVNLELQEGEILGLVGESGCGKSTLGLAVMRLLPVPPGEFVDGRMLALGTDLLELREKDLESLRGRFMSMIFQNPMSSLNPVLTVGYQITRVLRLHGTRSGRQAEQRAQEFLELVGFHDPRRVMSSYPHELSGGMQQRVAIAMALSCRPKLLVADEPTTALDVTIQAQILQLLLDLRRQLGFTVLLITHDLGLAAQTCDRIAVMYAGSLVEVGPVRDVLKWPAHPYTAALLGCVPRFCTVKEIRAVEGEVPSLVRPPDGCRFHPRCPRADEQCRTSAPHFARVGGRQVACFRPVREESDGR